MADTTESYDFSNVKVGINNDYFMNDTYPIVTTGNTLITFKISKTQNEFNPSNYDYFLTFTGDVNPLSKNKNSLPYTIKITKEQYNTLKKLYDSASNAHSFLQRLKLDKKDVDALFRNIVPRTTKNSPFIHLMDAVFPSQVPYFESEYSKSMKKAKLR